MTPDEKLRQASYDAQEARKHYSMSGRSVHAPEGRLDNARFVHQKTPHVHRVRFPQQRHYGRRIHPAPQYSIRYYGDAPAEEEVTAQVSTWQLFKKFTGLDRIFPD